MENHIYIHAHFYQPPRENPWLETIEFQESAYPYHDWNQRISAECYQPNAVSRILNDKNRIAQIVNNYSRISFNFGPTLLSWLEWADPETGASRQGRGYYGPVEEKFAAEAKAQAGAEAKSRLAKWPIANNKLFYW